MPGPLAARLIEARRTRRPWAFDTGLAPADSAQAYRVQAEVAAGLGLSVIGWKVGFDPTPERTPIAGPIFSCDARDNGCSYRLAHGEAVKVEVELALRLARDLPPRPGHPYGVDDILDATGEFLIGLELVGSRYRDPEAAPFGARLADNVNNAAYVAGAGIPPDRALDRTRLPCRLWADGQCVTDHVGGHADGDPLVPLVAWANTQVDALGGLKAGQILTTGCLNVPTDFSGPARLVAELGGIGRVALDLTAGRD